MKIEYEFIVWEEDEFYASGSAPTLEEAQALAGPYMLSGDGAAFRLEIWLKTLVFEDEVTA